MNYEKIAERQDKYEGRAVPLKEIPELTYQIWRESVNWKKVGTCLREKKISQYSNPDDLADGFITMLENSEIGLDHGMEVQRGKWYIIYDDINCIIWKMDDEVWGKNSVVMDNWVNFLMGD